MRTIALASMLLASVGYGADVPPPAPAPADDAFEQIENEWESARAENDLMSQRAEIGAQRAEIQAKRAALGRVRIAMADLEEPGNGFEFHKFADQFGPGEGGLSRRGSTQPLVVRTAEVDAATQTNLQEDLAVMGRILTKTLGKDGGDSAMGIVLSALPAVRRPQSVYLEGYGVLFFLNVKFPLVAPAAKTEEVEVKIEDPTWEQTRRELYGQKNTNVRFFNINAGGEGAVEYDAEQVQDLKKDLTEALRNATNIRSLKPDDLVTVVVTGNRGAVKARVKTAKSTGGKAAKNDVMIVDTQVSAPRETVLTLKAKKVDIDAMAKGTIDLAEFTKRVSTAAY